MIGFDLDFIPSVKSSILWTNFTDVTFSNFIPMQKLTLQPHEIIVSSAIQLSDGSVYT